ncbi:MAG: phage holin family protein [Candidatus Binatia bacterium]
MFALVMNWFVSALSLMLVAALIPGFVIRNFATALFAALVIGLVNATLGFLLKILTFPLTIMTFGLFLVVINAFMLGFAALFVPGFVIMGFFPAFFGALVLALVSTALRAMILPGA